MRKLTIRGLMMLATLLAIPAFVTLSASPAAAQAPATATVVLHVEGMHCATCPITVRTVSSSSTTITLGALSMPRR